MHHRSGRPRPPSRIINRFSVFLLAAGFLSFVICASIYLRTISTQIAISDASDLVSIRVNQVIADLMREGDFDADYFVSFEKGENGEIAAVSCSMARINALSAEILDRVVGATENYTATAEIPLGNLSGLSLLMGRGPKVPVEIVTLTSSRVIFHNNFVTAGINQTRHQITLQVLVDLDILVPWGSESAQVVSEVLIADTVIVGRVPGTYLDMNQSSSDE